MKHIDRHIYENAYIRMMEAQTHIVNKITTRLSDNNDMSHEAAEMLKALAHPVRLRIVAILCEAAEHVSNLSKRLELNQAMVSQQLRILRMRGLVKATRRNGFAHYELGKSHLKQMVSCIENCLFDRGATIP